MSFWKWYLGNCKNLRNLLEQTSFTFVEYLGGIFIIVIGGVGAVGTSLWFIPLIPVGITVMAHAYWREFEKNG